MVMPPQQFGGILLLVAHAQSRLPAHRLIFHAIHHDATGYLYMRVTDTVSIMNKCGAVVAKPQSITPTMWDADGAAFIYGGIITHAARKPAPLPQAYSYYDHFSRYTPSRNRTVAARVFDDLQPSALATHIETASAQGPAHFKRGTFGAMTGLMSDRAAIRPDA